MVSMVVRWGVRYAAPDFIPLPPDDEDHWDWDSDGSGYDTDEEWNTEEEEEEEEAEDIRPSLPLVQQGLQQEYLPFFVTWQQLPELLQIRLLPVHHRQEELVPLASSLGSSTKRSREGSDTEQVGMKRTQFDPEDNYKESSPSTSGLGPFRMHTYPSPPPRCNFLRYLLDNDSESD